MRAASGSQALDAEPRERIARVVEQPRRLQHVVQDQRLVDVAAAAVPGRWRRPRRCRGRTPAVPRMVSRLALARVHLARHDRGAGLVGRQLQLAEAAVGPGGIQAHVVGDLEQRPGQRAERRARRRHRVVARPTLRRDARPAAAAGPSPRPGAGWPARRSAGARRSRYRPPWRRAAGRTDPGGIRRVAGRRRRRGRASRCITSPNMIGVASCRCVRPSIGRSCQRRAPAEQRRAQPIDRPAAAVRGLERRQVHHRREHVVGRLAAVDVVVGMDRPVAAQRPTGDLVGAVGDHLVGVHVGACPSRSGTCPPETRRPRRRRRLRPRRRGSGFPLAVDLAEDLVGPAAARFTSPNARMTTRGQRRAFELAANAKRRRVRAGGGTHRRACGN